MTKRISNPEQTAFYSQAIGLKQNFNSVLALKAGTTQIRLPLSVNKAFTDKAIINILPKSKAFTIAENKELERYPLRLKANDFIFIKESFSLGFHLDSEKTKTAILYKADYIKHKSFVWKTSTHMRKELARFFYQIKKQKIQRLQEITDDEIHDSMMGNWLNIFWKDNPKFRNIRDAFAYRHDLTASVGFKWKDNPLMIVYDVEKQIIAEM